MYCNFSKRLKLYHEYQHFLFFYCSLHPRTFSCHFFKQEIALLAHPLQPPCLLVSATDCNLKKNNYRITYDKFPKKKKLTDVSSWRKELENVRVDKRSKPVFPCVIGSVTSVYGRREGRSAPARVRRSSITV